MSFYFTLLEISRSASITEVIGAYKTQARRWHPGKHLHLVMQWYYDKFKATQITINLRQINLTFLIVDDRCAGESYATERFNSNA